MKTRKKWLGILLVWISVCLSCNKDALQSYEVENVHPDSDVLLAEFVKILNQGPSAWQATLNPKSGGTYTMFFKMDQGGRVWTLIDFDVTSARDPKLGSYTLEAGANHASINFSTGTYLDDVQHKEGYRWVGADTSYAFQYANADTIVLLGNRNGDELKLVNITAEESLDFEYGILGNSYIYMYNFFTQQPYFSFTLPDIGPVQISIDADNRGLLLFYGENGRAQLATNHYAYGINRIVLKYPIRIGSYSISELLVDTGTQGFYVSYGGTRVNLDGANMPVVPLHLLLGTGYSPYISLPSPYYIESLPGWSTSFHEIFDEADGNMYYSAGLDLLVFTFSLDIENDLMDLNVYFHSQGYIYQATYPYRYGKTVDGVYSFEALPFESGNVYHENATYIQAYLTPFLDLVGTDSFTLQLYDAGSTFLAQMTSVQRPDIYFTGYMTEGYNLF